MGKSLIILGADFSENAVVVEREMLLNLSFENANQAQSASSTITAGFFYQPSSYGNMAGKTIVGIRVKPVTNGSIVVIKASGVSGDITSGDPTTGVAFTDIETINLTIGQEYYYFTVPVLMSQNEIIGYKYTGSVGGRSNIYAFTDDESPISEKVFTFNFETWSTNSNTIPAMDFILE